MTLDWLQSAEPHAELAARHASGWLAEHLPEVEALYGVPQTATHHPEVCTGAHMELCLQAVASLSSSFDVRFAVLTHDLGKALTPQSVLPGHAGHEKAGLVPLAVLCERLAVPLRTRQLAETVCEWHLHCHRAFEMNATSAVKFLVRTGLADDDELAESFFLACEADKRGRLGMLESDYPQGQFLRAVRRVLTTLPYPEGICMTDPAGNRIHQARVKAVQLLRGDFAPPQTAHD